MAERTWRYTYHRQCAHCSAAFENGNKGARYCSERCRTDAATGRRVKRTPGHWLTTPRTCGVCAGQFFATLQTGPNKRYCSRDCSMTARARYHHSWITTAGPTAQSAYNRARTKSHGSNTVWNRITRRYPDVPRSCEAADCIEARVLEIAHRPEFKRNGGWRTMDKYERHMFWVLCPTHHRILDFGIETAAQLGLS